MRLLLVAVCLSLGAACEKKPSEEEIAQQQAIEKAKASPKPKPGDWMWKKDRGNPLEKKIE